MNIQVNPSPKNDLLNWELKQISNWHPNFNEECKADFFENEKTIILNSNKKTNIRKGFVQDVLLDDETYSYTLSCDLKVNRALSPNDTTLSYGAYIAVYNIETQEIKRTQRYIDVTKDFIHLDLTFLIIEKRMNYRIGTYVDGICDAEFKNIQLQKSVYHGYTLEEGEAMM